MGIASMIEVTHEFQLEEVKRKAVRIRELNTST